MAVLVAEGSLLGSINDDAPIDRTSKCGEGHRIWLRDRGIIGWNS